MFLTASSASEKEKPFFFSFREIYSFWSCYGKTKDIIILIILYGKTNNKIRRKWIFINKYWRKSLTTFPVFAGFRNVIFSHQLINSAFRYTVKISAKHHTNVTFGILSTYTRQLSTNCNINNVDSLKSVKTTLLNIFFDDFCWRKYLFLNLFRNIVYIYNCIISLQ